MSWTRLAALMNSLAFAGDLEYCNRIAERFLFARNRAMLLNVRVHSGSVTLSRSAPLKYIQEEIDIMPFYMRHSHAKYILRSVLGGRHQEGLAAYRALSQVHNVPQCIFYALMQRTGAMSTR